MKLLTRLQQSLDFWFVLSTSILFFFLRLPSFFEPYWYGDEGIYEVVGLGLRHGRFLYRDIWDNKPPFLYLIYSLFQGDQMPVKIFSCIVGLLAVLLFFFIAKKLFAKKTAYYASTFLFALLLGLPFLEGNIANAENFMVLPSLISALLILYVAQKKQTVNKDYILVGLAGMALGISFLIKVVAIFDVAAFWFFLFICYFQLHSFTKLLKQTLTYSAVFLSAFFVPLILTIVFFVTHGALKIFLQSAFFSNVGYVNYGNQFIIPQGLLLGKIFILGGLCLILLWKKQVFSLTQLFVYIWLSFSLFSALFSQRPYTHYLLVFIASFSLFIGLLIQQQKQKVLHGILLIVIVFFIAKNFWYYNKTFLYYANYLSYATGKKTTEAYQTFFDQQTPQDYDVAAYIQTVRKHNEQIFIWGNSAQIYKLTNSLPPGKYTVAYHITANGTTIKETQTALIQTMPKYVIILQNADNMPYQLKHYKMKITFDNAIIYERTY